MGASLASRIMLTTRVKQHLIYYGPHRVLDLHGEGFVIGLQRLFRIQLVVLRSL